MIEQALREIGLTAGEIRVYLALSSLGCSSVGSIMKDAKISGSKVYEVLDRLAEKGLVSFIIKNGVKYFEAESARRIIDYLQAKEKAIQEQEKIITTILPEILMKQQKVNQGDRNSVKVYTGFEGLKTANEDIIQTLKKGEEWLSMGLSSQPKAWEIYFTKRQNVRAEKGIKHKHLLNEKYKQLVDERGKLRFTEFRFLPKSFEMPTSIEIYQNKVIIMILVFEDPLAIMIESKAVAESFRKYFSILWKFGKKVK